MHAIRSTQAPNAIRRLVTQKSLPLPVYSLPRALIATRGTVAFSQTTAVSAARNGFSTSSRLATAATTDLQAELLEGVTFGKGSMPTREQHRSRGPVDSIDPQIAHNDIFLPPFIEI
jgi:hypothetical protein